MISLRVFAVGFGVWVVGSTATAQIKTSDFAAPHYWCTGAVDSFGHYGGGKTYARVQYSFSSGGQGIVNEKLQVNEASFGGNQSSFIFDANRQALVLPNGNESFIRMSSDKKMLAINQSVLSLCDEKPVITSDADIKRFNDDYVARLISDGRAQPVSLARLLSDQPRCSALSGPNGGLYARRRYLPDGLVEYERFNRFNVLQYKMTGHWTLDSSGTNLTETFPNNMPPNVLKVSVGTTDKKFYVNGYAQASCETSPTATPISIAGTGQSNVQQQQSFLITPPSPGRASASR